MKQFYVSTRLLFFALLLSGLALKSQLITPFSSIYQVTQKGGIFFLSNSALGCSSNPPTATGTCAAGSLDLPILGTMRNDFFASTYIDIDSDASTFMSSSDSLNLPACSQITKAFLFWGASGTATAGYTQVKMKLNNGSYQNVTATFSQTNTATNPSYHCYADVTALLQSATSPTNGDVRVTVANIPSSLTGSVNTFGSWNLVIVYQNNAMNMRQLTVFNGLANVAASSPTISVPLSGFLTPTIGGVGFEIGVYAHDGDRALGGDNIYFNGLPLNDLLTNPANDVMNSTVSYAGLQNPYRKPYMNNTSGTDADIFVPGNLLNLALGNGASTSTIQLATTGDRYLVQALTTSIDSYEASPVTVISAYDVNGGSINPGDVLVYKIKATNIGTDAMTGSYVTDTLDANVSYVPNSAFYAWGPNFGPKTDVTGDDEVDYNTSTRVLKMRVGYNANGSSGGTMYGFFTGIDSTVITYSVMVTQSCLKLSCKSTIAARASLSGISSVFSHPVNTTSAPGINLFACVAKGPDTQTITNNLACGTPSASGTSTVCAGRTISLSASNDAEASYAWSGPSSFTSSLQNTSIANVTTARSGAYTVTLSVPNSTCQSVASTTVTVTTCSPQAINDFTTTAAGVTVSGNAAGNDINALPGGTFAITAQPSAGTVSIDAATGQYTFTPAPGFNGVTTATYEVCNSLPVACSMANITFTVYAPLAANPDAINTTPSVTANGTLLANDSGISAGLNYSVSLSAPAVSVGVMLTNAATGQYTFIPNPAFVGTTSITYTVCNISSTPTVCSTSSININVKPNPVPFNDGLITVANTSVSGNAAINDLGAAGGTFAISGAPASGSLTMDAATGQFIYTPAAGFNGVATAAYNLCNGAPVSCSSAVISVSVLPNILANNDVINTTSLTVKTGSLLSNDTGLWPGAPLSASITQVASTTGTLSINPATGEYTFTPNSSFTGSTQTTYTVCNTSVIPQQCSSASITIIVSDLPMAINDAASTVINTTVTGSAGANDSGTSGGTYTFGTTGSGTLAGNASTGQYTFTPAAGFTGTTSATYTLCNASSPPCSTASITFTVYPSLAANADAINTQPSVIATGSLLTNDAGVVSGTNYSVSFTQLPATTGTLTVNPVTGLYVFIPNAAFTGSAQTGYTVCNVNVNPQQCSTTTLSINVFSNPAPVNDAAVTSINVPVTGNAGSNDTGTAGGTFSITGQPANGTININATTGQFTFTPAGTFTGVTTATYNLCNGAPTSCSPAVISITVFPDVVANADVISSAPFTTASGNLLSNDTGISAGASYSLSFTPLPPSTGTITVDPLTGQYIFVPDPTFTGTAQTGYTLCNTAVSPQQCSSATMTITVLPNPAPMNDNALTVMNVPVSGDASLNDTGVSGGTFAIVGQPASGTITIDPATGQFTYTSTGTFTGVATATYNLCNGAPTSCSPAVISVTVLPNLLANGDVISTQTGLGATGNVILNDSGILPGVSYSVSVAPTATTTGTITIDPATGNYTFIPNASFTGSVVTTYTICNTSVNPQQCAVTTITIIVSDQALAMDDDLSTVVNTAVSGNVSSNDSGTFGSTYTFGASSNGTLTGNPATGQFTFTPASSFTGTAVATYTLCNLLAIGCSSANISVIVYPSLTASADVVNTTPSVTATGSLLANDTGIAAGASYSVSFTQLPASTGTLTVNNLSGNYSFTPDPTFTGTAQTSYTVCNTAVNPRQCSNTTITLSVLPDPVPVNDGTVTSINVAISGDASLNDLGVAGSTFAIVNQPASGTITIDAATGQYTYTPTSTFTGVATSTYNLCGGAPVSCSNAVISVTVFPNIVANPDLINTSPAVVKTGSLLSNDGGVSTSASYSVSIIQPAATTGTITLNPATGEYTFIPNATFTGSDVTGYTVCNISVNPQQCSSASIALVVSTFPIAVDDHTATVMNVAVSGDASSGDSGVLTGTFTFGDTSAATGTLSGDPVTGLYTYTPATGFTGTTSATYTLCNVSSPPCSTASITFTVFSTLTASADVVNTTPSVTTTGSLLANDSGVEPGPVFSVSFTPISTSAGTLEVDPANGHYTLIPNPGFTGTTSASYTVCNTSVNPEQCSSTSITINVLPNPVPVNDSIATSLNVPVTGSAAVNDNGTTGGTYSIVSQPSGGTVTINPATGEFSFTPAGTFTGVTTATYNLCNGAPASCSNAVISITVYPDVAANPDLINTTPLTSVTGSLLSNDTGITPGASYSVSATPVAVSVGILAVDPATGHYTFAPAPLFSGSVQTTYTVCNISVNPPQCAVTTITIVVTDTPVAVNDGTTTIMNIPVIGNAADNDSGTLGGIFTFGNTGSSTGTLTGNPLTGTYTFVPASGYTGTASATYTLCNLSLVCSTATITFTVDPILTASADVINASPSVTATGSLLANDAGITAGTSYSVSYTPIATSAGTLLVDPVSGQYTLIPNPAFTGTTSTSYTVCNTSVSPEQCSSAGIAINVLALPAPVNDDITTLINTPVSGDASLNDSGAGGGTFSIIAQPANGTVTIDPSTGQYTFTPASNFTGVTTATYQLCNGAPVTCSTAAISVSVYPDLVAVNDAINTTPVTTTTGSLLSNDTGITPGATYSVSVTPLSLTTGTLTVDPATGQYTFIPGPVFNGTASATYIVCNTGVNPQQCSSASITINVSNLPAAVNDATATIINTPVSGNVGSNDSGTLSGSFNFGSAGSGTLNGNALTGAYSYTPAAGFTGTASATYTLCNLNSPPCSTATIIFTVYPALTASADIVNTTPSVAATGSLLANDGGITSGASYSVNVTQPATSAGTISVDPATGQYTFTPNPAFTGTSQASYTVCNISVNPSQCSSATITLYVSPSPVPVDDHIATIVGASVTGNAGSNDLGATGGTFTILAQPANGTITINPATGQYTFTPAGSFTGITTATYQLCNGAPVTCSTAVISVSVYPNLSAVDDAINTAPLAVHTGSLLSNDIGVTSGGMYSVSVSALPGSTGTLAVDPATGEYTFTPGLLFTGTATTTYTVCNIGVIPQQCSSATITINVSNQPLAVDDATTTLINVPVSGNAGSNDSGTLASTFSFGNTGSGTGTLNGDPVTGNYTFTPASGFTGTASATYTLCNLLFPPCSTANITFTVYPALVANPDVISVTPSVTATGSLLTNDNGIVANAQYSVSITQPAGSTGTLTVNAATGEYTFVPDASFTGTATASYTVCNISLTPAVCSSATILIQSGNFPVAANDFTSTSQGVTVSGNVAANDSYTVGGTFTFGAASATAGTFSGSSSTGDYTFTPTAGFTGTTSVTYTLCNLYSPPCATAMIVFTVYPSLNANPDVISAVINVTADGNLETNDTGMILGETYSIAVAAVSPTIGALTVNAATGQYTFMPAANFTGNATTTYTLTHYNGTQQLQSSVATVTIIVNNADALIGLAKSVINVGYYGDGSFSLTYKLVAKNYSPVVPLTGIKLADNLSRTFPAPATYSISSAPALLNSNGSQLSLLSSYAGNGNDTLLTASGSSSLAPGRADTVVFTVRVQPHGVEAIFNNLSDVWATANGTVITDESVIGLNPDPDADGNPGNNNSPTPFDLHIPKPGLAKYASAPQSDGNGCYDVTFKFVIKNYGSSPIYNLSLTDSLNNTFGTSSYSVVSPPVSANGYVTPNTGYDGNSSSSLASGSSTLNAGQADTITIKVHYCSNAGTSFSNTAYVLGYGETNTGLTGGDASTNGLNPDPNGDSNPDEAALTIFSSGENNPPPEELSIPQGFSPNGDGINDRFEIKGLANYPNTEVTILNRWGNKVYSKTQYDNSWDGKSNEGLEFGGHDLPEGTYYYLVDLGNGKKPMKGYVYINRR